MSPFEPWHARRLPGSARWSSPEVSHQTDSNPRGIFKVASEGRSPHLVFSRVVLGVLSPTHPTVLGAGLWSPTGHMEMSPQEHAMLGSAERPKCSGSPPRGWPLPWQTPGPDTDSQAQHRRHEPNSIPRSAGCSLARVALLANLQCTQLLKRL